MSLSREQYAGLRNILLSPQEPMAKRFRAVFTLRNFGGNEAVEILGEVLQVDKSALLKHEVNYVLGQIGNDLAIPILKECLENLQEHPMVRHEAAEALGAIGNKECISLLEKFANDSSLEVAETCQIAIDRLRWVQENGNISISPFDSVDPAPAYEAKVIEELRDILLNRNLPMFERYRAMFSLRNIGTNACVEVMAEALAKETESALFRHEVAYVMGQLQNPTALTSLQKLLEDPDENPMVRHEAAESLGSIGTNETNGLLAKYLSDSEDVVKESCEVALDISDYFNNEEFHYTALAN